MLNPHDDPQTAADFLLCGIEAELERLGELPGALPHYRDRIADAAAYLNYLANNTTSTGDTQ